MILTKAPAALGPRRPLRPPIRSVALQVIAKSTRALRSIASTSQLLSAGFSRVFDLSWSVEKFGNSDSDVNAHIAAETRGKPSE